MTNQREIKFRLIKDNKVVGYEMFHEGKWVYSYPKENFNLGNKFIEHDIKNQFTGLKDHNGVEIYEGDVVEYNDSPDNLKLNEKQFLKVIWSERKARYNLEDKFSGYKLYKLHDYIEVIGNIYKSPDLMVN